MAAKRKCYICGEELHSINRRGLEYSVVLQNAKGSYHLCGRMKWNEKWSMLLSEQEDNPRIYSRPHPLCPSCFLKKLRRAVVALETALEGKEPAVDPEQDKQEAEKPEITAQEIREKYPEFYEKAKRVNDGKDVEDDQLVFLFKHRVE